MNKDVYMNGYISELIAEWMIMCAAKRVRVYHIHIMVRCSRPFKTKCDIAGRVRIAT